MREPASTRAAEVDWREVARLVLTSRAMDRLEEDAPRSRKEGPLPIFARAATTWRRCCSGCSSRTATRPAAIIARGRCCSRSGVPLADALGSGMGRAGGYSRRPRYRRGVQLSQSRRRARAADVRRGRRAIYAGGGLGAGDRLQGARCSAKGRTDAIAVVLGGDASCATGGFWSALTIATTQQLPMLFYVEDNGYGISVPSITRRRAATSPPTSPASAELDDLQRRRHRAGRGGAADRRGGRACPRRKRRRRCCG